MKLFVLKRLHVLTVRSWLGYNFYDVISSFHSLSFVCCYYMLFIFCSLSVFLSTFCITNLFLKCMYQFCSLLQSIHIHTYINSSQTFKFWTCLRGSQTRDHLWYACDIASRGAAHAQCKRSIGRGGCPAVKLRTC